MTKEHIEVEAVLRLALEALENIVLAVDMPLRILKPYHSEIESVRKLIPVIKEALAQPAVAEQHKQSTKCGEPVAKYIGECSEGSLVQLYEDVKKGTDLYTTPSQRKPLTDEQIPENAIRTRCQSCDGLEPEDQGRCMECGGCGWVDYIPPSPPQRKPLFKEFIKWAGAQGYDCAQTCNSDTGEWIALHPMTAELWRAWQAAHGRIVFARAVKAAHGITSKD